MYRGQEHIGHILRTALYGDYQGHREVLAKCVKDWDQRRGVRRLRSLASILCIFWVLPAIGFGIWSFCTGGQYWGLFALSVPASLIAGGFLLARDPDPNPELVEYRRNLDSINWLVLRLCEDRVEVSGQNGLVIFRGVHSRAHLQGKTVITYSGENEQLALTAEQVNVIRAMIPENTNEDSRAVLERHLGK